MGLFRRGNRDKNTQKRNTEATAAAPTVTQEQLLNEAAASVLPGFRTKAEAIDSVRENLELPLEDQRVEQTVEDVWARRIAEQTTWVGESDYEKLRLAFEDLGEQGVIARMDFTCCQTCGTDEIDDERTPIEVAEGYPFLEREYTFFHRQDADRLADDPAQLFLTYSSWRPADDIDPQLLEMARAGDEDARSEVVVLTDTGVGQRVSAALRSRGLDVRWDEDVKNRIAVQITDWRKPLPA
ncbi:hypothetical protein G7068_01150 [Leucobacter viscericola]|uniref:DUF6891 domain-containing protein n=1 Tax=Leucobacter viscericola TaxID=2714935 RepID=A0A6G7XC37_9MICO|nr:hypothetical protein [Leucobacter viscericola]QIK61967.1 hypothetical protein G7068_01150 [Leucobacter viscericola]